MVISKIQRNIIDEKKIGSIQILSVIRLLWIDYLRALKTSNLRSLIYIAFLNVSSYVFHVRTSKSFTFHAPMLLWLDAMSAYTCANLCALSRFSNTNFIRQFYVGILCLYFKWIIKKYCIVYSKFVLELVPKSDKVQKVRLSLNYFIFLIYN